MRRLVLLLLGVALPALAQGRPDESSMFGADDSVDAGADRPLEPAAAVDAGATGEDRDRRLLEGAAGKSRFDTDEEKSDPLKLGGSYLQMAQAFVMEGQKFKDVSLSAPSILETYLDARPNDRVRAFALGRLQWDPTRLTTAGSTTATGPSTGSIGLGTTASTAANPSVALDQLWVRFDAGRKVFFTVGRQKVRWGVGRIWYPTDFLNSTPKDPLNPFDQRLGVNMVKVHVPVESLGWNFYGYGLLDANGPASTLGNVGGAARAEFVLGPAELGLDGAWVAGRRPRYGVDLSSSLGPIDVYGEAAFRSGADYTLFRFPDGVNGDNPLASRVEAYRGEGYAPQVTAGASYQWAYNDKNTLFVTAEYFFNPYGYGSAPEYAAQLLAPQALGVTLDPSQNNTLYRGRHYLAVTVAAPGLPDLSWVTLSASNILNLVDPSGLARVDASFRVLTYLTLQAWGGVFYGADYGQFSMHLDTTIPAGVLGPVPVPIKVPAPKAQAGLMLRLAI